MLHITVDVVIYLQPVYYSRQHPTLMLLFSRVYVYFKVEKTQPGRLLGIGLQPAFSQAAEVDRLSLHK
jgi:hypothetical protein